MKSSEKNTKIKNVGIYVYNKKLLVRNFKIKQNYYYCYS